VLLEIELKEILLQTAVVKEAIQTAVIRAIWVEKKEIAMVLLLLHLGDVRPLQAPYLTEKAGWTTLKQRREIEVFLEEPETIQLKTQ
jgi:hypothetical protein